MCDLLQMIVEIKPVIGEVSRRIHRAAVRDHDQNTPLFTAADHPAAGPFYSLADYPLAKQVRLQQRGDIRLGAAPGGVSRFIYDMTDFIQPARIFRPSAPHPFELTLSTIPGAGSVAKNFGIHFRLFQGATQHVDKYRHRLDMLLHGAGTVNQHADQAISMRPEPLLLEQMLIYVLFFASLSQSILIRWASRS